MSLEVCILASGSAGNCTAVRTPVGVVLLDAGIGPRTTARRLVNSGVRIGDIVAICLTHLDRDHFSPHWVSIIVARGIRVFCCERKIAALMQSVRSYAEQKDDADQFEHLICGFRAVAFEPIDAVRIRPVPLAHDYAGSHGFLIEGHGCRVGYASDLGRVPEALIEQFCDLDVLAIESNYDAQMQRDSGRPWFLRERIMGPAGHLSNEQAFDAVRRILDRCETRGRRLPSHIVLLHRSRQCNCPRLVRRMFSRDSRIGQRLVLAEQYQRSDWLRPRVLRPIAGEQLALAWG